MFIDDLKVTYQKNQAYPAAYIRMPLRKRCNITCCNT